MVGWEQYLLLRVFKFPRSIKLLLWIQLQFFFPTIFPPNKNSSKYNIPFMTPMIVPPTPTQRPQSHKSCEGNKQTEVKKLPFQNKGPSPWRPATPGLRVWKEAERIHLLPFSPILPRFFCCSQFRRSFRRSASFRRWLWKDAAFITNMYSEAG